MTFLSTHQSPRTVNKNANEFVIGTVKLNSKISSASYLAMQPFSNEILILTARGELTSLPNQQKEPNTARQINDQRDSISRIPKQIHDPKERSIDFALEPTILDSFGVQDRMWKRLVSACCGADERCRKAPRDSDHQEPYDIAEDRQGGLRGSCGVVHFVEANA